MKLPDRQTGKEIIKIVKERGEGGRECLRKMVLIEASEKGK